MPILALLLAAQDAPHRVPVKTFGDWTVACDNVRRCEMTSLIPEASEQEDAGYDGAMSVSRDAGPAGGYVVEFDHYGEYQGIVTLAIDGVALASGRLDGATLRVPAAAVPRVLAAMANGKEADLLGSSGKRIARASLSGSSAALRFIDAEQGRAGTVTAAVAKGPRPAGAVPAASALPRIAGLLPSGKAAAVSERLRAELEKQGDCEGMYEGMERPPVESYALGGGKTLVLLPCGAGAYNFSSVAFILSGGKASRAEFDVGDGMLVNAGYEKGVLSSYAKGRGIGDCGNSESYVWDGRRFRMIESRQMDVCRGSMNWLATFRAEPVLR